MKKVPHKYYLNQLVHARKRFLERTGVKFTRQLHLNLKHQIHTGKAVRIRSGMKSDVYLAKIKNKYHKIVYDKRTNNVVTVLPNDS